MPREGADVASTLPGALSYTALTQLERCGYRYYLEDVLRLPETESSPSAGDAQAGSARARGRILHGLLESFAFDGKAAPSAEDVRVAARELGTSMPAAELDEIAALLAGLRGTELARRLCGTGVRREQPFAFVLDAAQPILTGVIDALVREREEHWLIVDYKSDCVAAEDDLEALVRSKYELQRLIYALAALREGARRVEVVHWFLERPHEQVSASFARAQAQSLESTIGRRLREARGRGYAVSEHPNRGLCAGCPGRGTLCSWDEQATLRAPP
jgi:ATP-dependent exoDNAse (exonuclease V) beta subunit